MEDQDLYKPSISIRVIYQDLPDLIELETRVVSMDWRGVATAYTSPRALAEYAARLSVWAREPVNEFKIEAGADTGAGWMMLRFYTVDLAGHIRCQVTLATDQIGRTDEVSRLVLAMPTEPGLVERFAKHLATLSNTFEGEARLEGLAA
jgi:hypothetical protein